MTRENKTGLGKIDFKVTTPIMAVMAIFFGILVIVFKDLLPWLVGLYFIIQGILFFIESFEHRSR